MHWEVVADIEPGYGEHLGSQRLAELKALLADLGSHSDSAGALGTE